MSSVPDSDGVFHTWFCGIMPLRGFIIRWTFLASFFCVKSVIAFLTAEFVKCGNSFEKHERFSHLQRFFQLSESPNRIPSVPYLSG